MDLSLPSSIDARFPTTVQGHGHSLYRRHATDDANHYLYLPDGVAVTNANIDAHGWRATYEASKGKPFFTKSSDKTQKVWALPEYHPDPLVVPHAKKKSTTTSKTKKASSTSKKTKKRTSSNCVTAAVAPSDPLSAFFVPRVRHDDNNNDDIDEDDDDDVAEGSEREGHSDGDDTLLLLAAGTSTPTSSGIFGRQDTPSSYDEQRTYDDRAVLSFTENDGVPPLTSPMPPSAAPSGLYPTALVPSAASQFLGAVEELHVEEEYGRGDIAMEEQNTWDIMEYEAATEFEDISFHEIHTMAHQQSAPQPMVVVKEKEEAALPKKPLAAVEGGGEEESVVSRALAELLLEEAQALPEKEEHVSRALAVIIQKQALDERLAANHDGIDEAPPPAATADPSPVRRTPLEKLLDETAADQLPPTLSVNLRSPTLTDDAFPLSSLAHHLREDSMQIKRHPEKHHEYIGDALAHPEAHEHLQQFRIPQTIQKPPDRSPEHRDSGNTAVFVASSVALHPTFAVPLATTVGVDAPPPQQPSPPGEGSTTTAAAVASPSRRALREASAAARFAVPEVPAAAVAASPSSPPPSDVHQLIEFLRNHSAEDPRLLASMTQQFVERMQSASNNQGEREPSDHDNGGGGSDNDDYASSPLLATPSLSPAVSFSQKLRHRDSVFVAKHKDQRKQYVKTHQVNTGDEEEAEEPIEDAAEQHELDPASNAATLAAKRLRHKDSVYMAKHKAEHTEYLVEHRSQPTDGAHHEEQPAHGDRHRSGRHTFVTFETPLATSSSSSLAEDNPQLQANNVKQQVKIISELSHREWQSIEEQRRWELDRAALETVHTATAAPSDAFIAASAAKFDGNASQAIANIRALSRSTDAAVAALQQRRATTTTLVEPIDAAAEIESLRLAAQRVAQQQQQPWSPSQTSAIASMDFSASSSSSPGRLARASAALLSTDSESLVHERLEAVMQRLLLQDSLYLYQEALDAKLLESAQWSLEAMRTYQQFLETAPPKRKEAAVQTWQEPAAPVVHTVERSTDPRRQPEFTPSALHSSREVLDNNDGDEELMERLGRIRALRNEAAASSSPLLPDAPSSDERMAPTWYVPAPRRLDRRIVTPVLPRELYRSDAGAAVARLARNAAQFALARGNTAAGDYSPVHPVTPVSPAAAAAGPYGGVPFGGTSASSHASSVISTPPPPAGQSLTKPAHSHATVLRWDVKRSGNVLISQSGTLTMADASRALQAVYERDPAVANQPQPQRHVTIPMFAIGTIGISQGEFVFEVRLELKPSTEVLPPSQQPPSSSFWTPGRSTGGGVENSHPLRAASGVLTNSAVKRGQRAPANRCFVGLSSKYYRGPQRGTPAYLYGSDGTIVATADDTHGVPYGCRWHCNAVITAFLSFSRRELSFAVDGVPQGVAFKFQPQDDPEPLFPLVVFLGDGDSAAFQPPQHLSAHAHHPQQHYGSGATPLRYGVGGPVVATPNAVARALY